MAGSPGGERRDRAQVPHRRPVDGPARAVRVVEGSPQPAAEVAAVGTWESHRHRSRRPTSRANSTGFFQVRLSRRGWRRAFAGARPEGGSSASARSGRSRGRGGPRSGARCAGPARWPVRGGGDWCPPAELRRLRRPRCPGGSGGAGGEGRGRFVGVIASRGSRRRRPPWMRRAFTGTANSCRRRPSDAIALPTRAVHSEQGASESLVGPALPGVGQCVGPSAEEC